MPIAEVPFVVRGETVALFALVGVLFANCAVGGPAIAFYAHCWSLRTGKRRHGRFARELARASVGFLGVVAALAVVWVFLVAATWPGGWDRILALYARPLAALAALLLLEVALLAYYTAAWGRGRRALHLGAGAGAVLAGAGLLLAANAALAGVLAALPYVSLADNGVELLADRFDFPPATQPAWASLAVFRLVGAISFSGLVVATVSAALQIRARSFEAREYRRWATGFALRCALWPLLVLPLPGLLYLGQASPTGFEGLRVALEGDLRWAFDAQVALLAALFLLGNWYLVRRLSFPAPRLSGARIARHWTYAAGMVAVAVGFLLAWQASSSGTLPEWENWGIVGGLVLLYGAALASLQRAEDAVAALPRQDWARHAGALLPVLAVGTAILALASHGLSIGGFTVGANWQRTAFVGVATLVTPVGVMYLKAWRFRLLERWPHYSRLVPTITALGAVWALFALGYVRDVALSSYVASRQLAAGGAAFAGAAPNLTAPLPTTTVLWLLTLTLLAGTVLAWLAFSAPAPVTLAAAPRAAAGPDRRREVA